MARKITIERQVVVAALAHLRRDLDEAELLGDAALLLLSDVVDYLALSQQEKETVLGYMNVKAVEQWQAQKVVLLKDRATMAGIVEEPTVVAQAGP